MNLWKDHNLKEKHIGYYALLDACRLQGCPICLLLKKYADRFVEFMLYENVNDPDVRSELRKSYGFCSTHTGILLRIGDGFGISIIVKDIIQFIENHLLSGDLSALEPSHECPVCLAQREHEEHYCSIVTDHLHDEELQRSIELSSGFCLPHLRMLFDRVEGEKKDFLVASHIGKLTGVIQNLEKFIHVQDYRFHDEPLAEQEAQSWKRGVYFLAGEER
jgi:hypothetical protein